MVFTERGGKIRLDRICADPPKAVTKEKARELSKLRGTAFDRAYVQNEVAFHRTVNGALSSTLIPGAHNAELKSLLETGLTLFQEHQKHAEQLAKSLQ